MALFKFQRLLSTLYDGLPSGVRNFIGPVLEPSYFTVKRILVDCVSTPPVNVYQFQGKSRWGERTLTTLLFGEGRGMLPYILNLLYADKPTKKKLGKIFLWKVKSEITLRWSKAWTWFSSEWMKSFHDSYHDKDLLLSLNGSCSNWISQSLYRKGKEVKDYKTI